MSLSIAELAGASVGTALLTLSLPYLAGLSPPAGLLSFVSDFGVPDLPFHLPFRAPAAAEAEAEAEAAAPFVCRLSHYRTEIVSLDPLLIYIHSFLAPAEIDALLALAEPRFAPSEVTRQGAASQRTRDRTSSSAGLPREAPAVQCVLARAREFLGAVLRDGRDEVGPPQLVRYTAGQRFNAHHDWYDAPRRAADGSGRTWNRVASFFAVLQDNCTGGETHFPHVRPPAPAGAGGEGGEGAGRPGRPGRRWQPSDPAWRAHEEGGLAFRPVRGNALFWVNLHANGTGDERTAHSGRPVGEGLKTAMNIWPRQYYGPW